MCAASPPALPFYLIESSAIPCRRVFGGSLHPREIAVGHLRSQLLRIRFPSFGSILSGVSGHLRKKPVPPRVFYFRRTFRKKINQNDSSNLKQFPPTLKCSSKFRKNPDFSGRFMIFSDFFPTPPTSKKKWLYLG